MPPIPDDVVEAVARLIVEALRRKEATDAR